MNNLNELAFEQMNEIFDKLSSSLFQYLLEAVVNLNSKDNRAANMVFLISLAILAYAGVEVVKLIFRNNFGRKGVSTTRLVLSVIAFIAISGTSLHLYLTFDEDPMSWGSKPSFLATSVFYVLITIFIIYKGGIIPRNEEVHVNYRGDSSLLGLALNNWKQSTIQNLAEPLLCFALGIFLLPFNFLWGIPLIFCAISAWLFLAVENIVKLGWIRDGLSNAMSPRNRQKIFSRVQSN